MKYKCFIFVFVCHFGFGIGAFLGLNAWLLAAQDAGRDAAVAPWLGLLVDFVLLQPLAHWVLVVVPLSWWTWSGLLALGAVVAGNSLLVAAAACAAAARLARRRRAS